VPLDAESIRKAIELEAAKGYHDSAVIGGLDRLLARWSAQAMGEVTDARVRKRLAHLAAGEAEYASLNLAQRPPWVAGFLDLLARIQRPDKTSTTPVTPPTPLSPPRPARRVAPGPSKVRAQPGAAASHPIRVAAAPPGIDAAVTALKGISTNMAARFHRLGVTTVRDLLYFFPRRHLDYSQRKSISMLTEGKEETIVATVWEARPVNVGRRRSTEAIVGDDTGNIRVVWFNNPYVARNLKANSRIVISGRVGLFRGQHVFESPEWEMEESETIHTGRLVPLYHLTQGLTPRLTRKLIKSAVDEWAGQAPDFLPEETRSRRSLFPLSQAISQAHFPDDLAAKDRARVRLAFDELFLLQLGVLSKKRAWQEGLPGRALVLDATTRNALDRFVGSLPFKLTAAQDRAFREIQDDLLTPRPMSRLLQGDVGSGKTVVATAALLVAVANGYQGAFMAPTEILAEQHFATLKQLLSRTGPCLTDEPWLCSYAGLLPRPVTVALLTGDITASARREVSRRIAEGAIDVVVGTHAIIQKGIAFNRLGMAVVDEQHRFGVGQRSALRQKGTSPHILVMTATPIPRTLALTLYGDLDLSAIDQMPAGRQAIKTRWLKPEQRDSAYAFIKREVDKGRQAFVICPLVEESDAIQARAAVAEYEHLANGVFPGLRLGLLHGRMAAADKDAVMHRFRSGELHILVATPVIEVGIDVPNATVMMVESADRFGLSQLHQFRGRVGRGTEQSYCILLAENPSLIGIQRLDIIERVYDGFKLAEEDLRLRGPGEFFGTRQSGLPDLRMARLSDVAILEAARSEATSVFNQDPGLKSPQHAALARELTRVWPASAEWSI
jgi:ATP-dependent DNA helicase RecG